MTEAARERLAQIRLRTAAVIPVYCEEKHISDVVRRTRQQLDHVLVVDDGSEDSTAQRAREAALRGGARVIFDVMEVPGGDKVAMFSDPQGAMFIASQFVPENKHLEA